MNAFTQLGLFPNAAIFAVAAVFVWGAGVQITRYANVISEKTGLGQALIGMLMLGGVTSLPELAVAVTSSVSGDAQLAVNSVLGGIAMQVAILAVADMLIGKQALTAVVPNPIVFLQGALKILLLSTVTAAIVAGDLPVLGVGLWMWLLLLIAVFSFWTLAQTEERRPWRVSDDDELSGREKQQARKHAAKDRDKPLSWAVTRAVVAAAFILAAGYVLSRTGDAIADQTGLGESFVGAVFLAISTSLPEISSVFAAARAGLFTMAVSDIFGTNMIDVSFLFIIDATDGFGAVINEVGSFSAFATIVAIGVTAMFMAGLAERRDVTFLRMGIDSIAVLVTYLGGLVVLYFLR